MDGISNFFSGIFGGKGGFQPTDINPAPTGTAGVAGVPPMSESLGIPTSGGTGPLWQKLVTGGMLGAGELGNILQEHKSQQYQNTLLDLIKNPAKLSAMVTSATKPLDNALVQAVNNRVQGDMASRGLAQAPGIFAASEAQALAPFQQQNQQTAEQQVLTSLGLPGQVTGINQPPSNLSPAFAQFLKMFQPQSTWNPNAVQPVPQQTQTPQGITFPDTSTWGLTPQVPSFGGGQ